MTRVEAVSDRSQVATEHQQIADAVRETFGGLRGPHSIMLLSPPADEHALALGNYFRYNSLVPSPLRELAIITGMREKDCLYIWTAQVGAGRRSGLSEEAISTVRDRGDVSKLSPDERRSSLTCVSCSEPTAWTRRRSTRSRTASGSHG